MLVKTARAKEFSCHSGRIQLALAHGRGRLAVGRVLKLFFLVFLFFLIFFFY
jgi:hypothetical protein